MRRLQSRNWREGSVTVQRFRSGQLFVRLFFHETVFQREGFPSSERGELIRWRSAERGQRAARAPAADCGGTPFASVH